MNTTATLFASLLLLAGQAPTESDGSFEPLPNFVVTPIYEVRVPAREQGALTALEADRGDVVQEGQLLGRVDDSDARIRKAIAENELQAAKAEAESDAELQAAIATIGVAKAEYEGSKETVALVENAISEFELRRNELTYVRSRYQADTTRVKYEVAQITRSMREAQLEAVKNEIERREIVSPISGVITDRHHQVGEWAQAGEPIYSVVHMDRLRVEGTLDADFLTPEEIALRPSITIYVKTPKTAENPRGEVRFEGTIDFISQEVDPSGEFLVSAEFDNPRKTTAETVQWAVRPGLEARITLDSELMKLIHQRRPQR